MNFNRRCLYSLCWLYELKLALIFKRKAIILLASLILTNSALACDNSEQPSGNFLIQAECYESFDGVQVETTTDIGGGQNVGYIDAFDSMTYSLNIPTSGNYLFQYRTASLYGSDPGFSVYVNDQIVDSFSIPSTNGWQNWQTLDGRVINLSSGSNTIKFIAFSSGMNLNWFRLSPSSLVVSQPPEAVGNFEDAEPIDNSKWHHQTLLPNGYSWYNGELQHYTNRLNNSYVSNGTLKIVARKETFNDQGHTKQYTSARLNSKFAFRYGRVEFRAKMPYGSGTWPAVWMLGKNIDEDGSYWDQRGYGNTSWPAVGEIDILEHWGSNQGYASSAVHTTSSSGNTENYGGTIVSDISSKFHIYSMEWDSDKIIFKIDGNEHYRYDPSVKNNETWPFDDEFFLLLNVAIEPSISSGFTQSQMEIDYIRVYNLNGEPIWSDEFGSVSNDEDSDESNPSENNNLLTGSWKLAPTAEAMSVGPSLDDLSWWSNSGPDVLTRYCHFDDVYSFNADGSFGHDMQDATWLEGWQGAAEGCGAPVAPHDGSNPATYVYDATAGTLTVSGDGAHIGLAKVHNTGEDGNSGGSITYEVSELTDTTMTLDINFGPGYWRFKLVKHTSATGDTSLDNELLSGDWMLSPTAGSLGVGPSQGNISWWSTDEAEAFTRACLYDDIFSFNSDGSFANVMGGDTWLEGWQGTEGCGAPVSPFDGSNAATYSYDASAGTLTVYGLGAHIGLPKVTNDGEIDNVANAVSSVTYTVTEISDTAMTLDIDFGGGWWRYELVCADDSCTGSAGESGSDDTGSGDTGSGDTGSGDTGSGDTGSGDTGSGDTGSGDTGSGDTGSGDTGSDGSDLNNGNTDSEYQIVSISNTGAVSPGQQFTLDVNYDVSSGDNTVTGLGLYIHYDSSKLTFSQISDYINKDIVTTAFSSSLDVEDFDNDSSTDRYVTLAWAAVFSGDWPNVPLPTKLLSIDFTVNDLDLDSTDTTTISFSSPSNDAGFDFYSNSYQLLISPTAPMSWDVDHNGEADALTDGLLMLRYAFGLTGESLVNNAVAINSPLDSSEIEQSIIETLSIADIDNNGQVDALTDGLLLLRYLFGLTGDALISNSVALDAARATHADIEQYIINHMPGQQSQASDITPPEIILVGDAASGVAFGDSYIELGAVANDDNDGDIEVIVTGEVGEDLGTYVLTYTAVDAAGNSSSVTRSVVVDHAPTISSFEFLRSNNPSLTDDITLDVSSNTISGRIPENISVKDLVATYSHNGESVSVSSVNQVNGSTVNDFTQLLEYRVSKTSGVSKTYSVDVTKFTGLPIIYLTTTNNASIDSKEEYVLGTVRVDGGRNIPDMEPTPIEIRGRGNSTWDLHPKKPYQMKFSTKKKFLGMPEDKKWIFLAEYSDKTMLRNSTVFEMGYISNLDWTPESEFAEVYINDEYRGTYNIAQKVEETNRRVAITNDGYLLEVDNQSRLKSDDVYFTTDVFSQYQPWNPGDTFIVIKEPNILPINENGIPYYQDERFIEVSNHIKQFEQVLFSDDFTNISGGYADYIDVDSFVDWFLINEIIKNVDARWFSSIYFHWIPGGKIKMGPLWDHDLGFGNVDYADSQYTDGWWIRQNPWIGRLFEDPNFFEKVRTRFNFFRQNQEYILDKIDEYADKLKWSQQENNNKWQTFGQYVWPNPVFFDSHQEEVEHLKQWYKDRMSWLDSQFNSNVLVTFKVDMNDVTTNPDGVYIAGGDLGQEGFRLFDNGNDVWSITLLMPSNTTYKYKFRNQPSYGTWEGFESRVGLDAGNCSMGNWGDRFIDVGDIDIVLDVVAYGSCTANPF